MISSEINKEFKANIIYIYYDRRLLKFRGVKKKERSESRSRSVSVIIILIQIYTLSRPLDFLSKIFYDDRECLMFKIEQQMALKHCSNSRDFYFSFRIWISEFSLDWY